MLRISPTAARSGAGTRVGIHAILSHRWSFAALLALISIYVLFLLSNGTFQLFAPELFSRAYGNMLMHMLHGEFTVDREVIGYEAFPRDGKAYSYFGIFSSLLRFVALPFTDVTQVELARLSCLAAVVIFIALQLRMLLIVHDSLPAGARAPELLAVMVAATVLSGPQIYILASAWIYHEPILWAAAMAAGFNLIVIRAALTRDQLGGRDLVWLATLAGLAINTRPSIGVALCLGTALLVLWAALQWHSASDPDREISGRAGGLLKRLEPMARDRRILAPIAILGWFAIVVGVVNFEKWGNPFTFADYRYATYAEFQENALEVLRNYGAFNLERLWVGALYYATGIPWLLKGVPPFAEFLHARYQGIEAPPFTPLLTNPITVLLAAVGLYRLWWKPDLPARCRMILRLTLIGHSAAVLLIFTAMFLALRYRFDLAPFMTLAALIGYRSVAIAAAGATESWRRRLRAAAIGLCVLGILFSHYVLVLHKVWSAGVPSDVRAALVFLSPVSPFKTPP